MSTVMVEVVYLYAPSKSDPTLSPELAFYAVTDEQRRFLLTAHTPFLILPVIMFFDMSYRIIRLMKSGIEVEKTRKNI